MKKLLTFFTFLGALLCFALPASAVDYYVAGSFTDWGNSKIQMESTSDGSYVCTATVGDEATFKIVKIDGSSTYWYGMDNTTVTWVASISGISNEGESGGNINIAHGGTYRFVLTPNGTSSTLDVYPSIIYLGGGVANSGDSGSSSYVTRDESTEGVFTTSFEISGGSWFWLGFNDSRTGSNSTAGIAANASGETTWSSTSGTNSLVFNCYPQSFVPSNAGVYTITIDLLNASISYTRGEAKPSTPVISYDSESNTVTITCATSGATIYYTTDGSTTPSASSTQYTGAISVPRNGLTISAIAIKDGKESDVASGTYSYTSHVPAQPVMVNNGDNTLTLTCTDSEAVIYYTIDGSTPSASNCAGSGTSPVTVTVPEGGLQSGIRAIAINEDGDSDVLVYSSAIAYVLPVPTITVATVDGKGVFTITNNYAKGGTLVCVASDGQTANFDTTTGTITLTETGTVTAYLQVAGTGSSASVSASWTNPSDKKPIYYVSKSKGWSKTVNGVAVPNAIAIAWDSDEQAYVISGIVAEIGTSNTFRFSNATDVSTWDSFNANDKVATLTAGEAGEVKTTTLSHNGNSNINCDVSKIGYWTLKINGDFTEVTYSWDGPISEDVSLTGWSLYSTRTFPVGTTKYFYLSAEQNDSRVSPEWELTKQTDGSYAINNFMVIPAGQFIIRQIDRTDTDAYTIHDWGYDGSGKVVNSTEMGIPTSGDKVAEGTYTATYDMTDDAARGWMWNIGYTMASVKVVQVSEEVENGSLPIIYYYSTSSTAPGIYMWNNSNDSYNTTVKMTKSDGDYYFYKITEADQAAGYDRLIFQPTYNSWTGQSGNIPFNTSTSYVYINSSLNSSGLPTGLTCSTNTVTLTANLNQPSTLKVAKKQGMPYVSLMGEFFATQLGDNQLTLMNDDDSTNDPLTFVANLQSGGDNQSPTNTGFTNGFIYHNSDGNPVIYSDASVATRKGTRNGSETELYVLRGKANNMNTSAATSSSTNSAFYIKANAAINSTRQPPVYPIKFFGMSDGQVIELTSSELRLNYVGEEEVAFTFNGSSQQYTTDPQRVAKYTASNIPMLGRVKVFSGNGSQRYGNSWNGLSLYNNWGVNGYDEDLGVYSYKNAESKVDVPLSGAGPYHHESSYDGTNRPITNRTNTSGDEDSSQNFGYEDNHAGNYINFADRSYVSLVEFYYGLEKDTRDGYSIDEHDISGTENNTYYNNAGYDGSDSNEARPTNTGRNYSWIRFTFTESDQRIELDKEGANTGRITYAINEDGSQDEYIETYTVSLYQVDPETGEKLSEVPVWTKTVNIDGTTTYSVDETIQRVPDLEDGWYRAEITTTFNSDENGERTVTDQSRMIQVRSAAGRPSISAAQVINANSDGTKEYTLDVVISSNLSSFAQANAEEDDEFVSSDMTAVLTIPVESGNKLQISTDGGENYSEVTTSTSGVTYADNKWTYTKTGFTGEDDVTLPLFKVVNTLPAQTLTYTITASVAGAAGEKSRTASVTIKAPLAQYVGTAEFEANWNNDGLDGYTSVTIDNGRFELRDPDDTTVGATIASSTLEDYTLSFGVDYSDKAGSGKQFAVTRTATGGALELSAKAAKLPYWPEESDDEYVPAKQSYSMPTTLTYVRGTVDSNTGSASVGTLDSDIDASKLTLNTPREGLKDVPSTTAGMDQVVPTSDYKPDGTTDAKDYIRIQATWQEKWGGVNNQVEDALIAAEITQPTANTVFRLDADKQTISHHEKSIFNPDSHYYSKAGDNQIHEQSPGSTVTTSEEFWKLHGALTKAQHIALHPDFVERVGVAFNTTSDMYKGNSTHVVVSSPSDFVNEAYKLWAGCKMDDSAENYLYIGTGSYTLEYDQHNYVPAGTFNKADGSMGYYGYRNHHTRKGWHGGDLFSGDWFMLAFAQTMTGTGREGDITKLLPSADGLFPGTEKDDRLKAANDALSTINGYIASGSGMPLYDSKLVDGKTGVEFGKAVYLGAFGADPSAENYSEGASGRVMLRVNHVNHESWYGHSDDVTAQWNGTTGFPTAFQKKLDHIRVDHKYYTPVAYNFSYEYPVLTTIESITIGGQAANVATSQLAAVRTATSGTTTDVTARSTGMIAFDTVEDTDGDITTAIQSVGADAAGANGRYFSYSRESQMLTVISTDGVKGVSVAAVDGRVMKQANGRGAETLTVSLSDLAEGYYVVTAEGVGSIKLLK